METFGLFAIVTLLNPKETIVSGLHLKMLPKIGVGVATLSIDEAKE